MTNNSLDYRVMHPTSQIDDRTYLSIMDHVAMLTKVIKIWSRKERPKIMVDNNMISNITPDLKAIVVAGYVPGHLNLYLGSTYKIFSVDVVPLSGPLEEMTNEKLYGLAA